MYVGYVQQSFTIVQSDGLIGGLMSLGGGAHIGVGGSYASNSVTAFHGGIGSYYLGAGEMVFIGIPEYRTQVAQAQVSPEFYTECILGALI